MKLFSLKIAVLSGMFSNDLCLCHGCFLAAGSEDAGFSILPSSPSQGVPAVESEKCLRFLITI